MDAATSAPDIENLLCGKGLCRNGGLLAYLTQAAREEAGLGVMPGVDLDVVKADDLVIRDVFNARYTALELFDRSAKEAEMAKRETMLSVLYRLYACGRRRTPSELRRALFAAEIDNVLSALVRLTLTSRLSLEAVAAHCESRSSVDNDLLAHAMDPLQLRYVLCHYGPGVAEQIGQERLAALVAACRVADRARLRAWFEELVPHLDILSKEAPQFLRSLLLEMWRMGSGDVAGLAYEIAILDVRLFEEMGWETTRAFCAMLRRITAPGAEVLDPFLSDEDIDTALLTAEALSQDELVTHFRKLAATYNTKISRDLSRSVQWMARSHVEDAVPAAENVAARNSDAARPWYRSLGLATQAV